MIKREAKMECRDENETIRTIGGNLEHSNSEGPKRK